MCVNMAIPNAHIKSFPRLPSIDAGSAPHRETILLVDDHPSIRKLLGSILKSERYVVLEAEDGRQALELCRRYGSRIHLLLTDIVMPQMNGPLLAEQVVVLCPDIRILYMSGYVDPLAFKKLQPQGDAHFLKKPCDIQEVSRKVRALLDQV
jgi:two-component system, cell cycle sensor histidine kinase and response regulator CckA